MEARSYIEYPHIGAIPSDWVLVNAIDVCEKITDGTHDTPVPVKEGVPYIKSVHIKKGTINFNNCLYLSKQDHDIIYRRCNPELGDLLIVNIGAGNVGECAYVGVDFQFSMKNIALLKPNRKLINDKYLYYYYKSVQEKVVHRTKTGGAQPFLSLRDLKKLKIIIPSVQEQTKIAQILSTWDKAIVITEQLLNNSQQQKFALMQQLISGKKRFQNFGSEWHIKALKQLANITKGKQRNKNTLTDKGSYPVVNGGMSPSGYTEEFNRVDNTVTISEGGNSCGYIAYQKNRFWCGGHCYSLESLGMSITFIYHLLKFNESKIMRLRVGSGLPNIQKRDIEAVKLFLPSDAKEQQKISTVLSSADREIEILQLKLDYLKQEKKVLIQQLLTGKRRVRLN